MAETKFDFRNESLDSCLQNWKAELEDLKSRLDKSEKKVEWSVALEKEDVELIMLRTIIAKRSDVESSWKAFSNICDWRVTWKGNEVLNWDDPEREQKTPHLDVIKRTTPMFYFQGTNLRGQPVCYELRGRAQVEEFNRQINLDRYKEFLSYFYISVLRHLDTLSRQQNKLVQICFVQDLKDVTMAKLKFFAEPAAMLYAEWQQTLFLESFSNIFVANPPWFFSILWNMASVFLDRDTKEKIAVLPAKEQGTRRLFELIDSKNVPTFLEGSVEVADLELCDPKRGMTKLDIGAGKNRAITKQASRAGEMVSWRFKSEWHRDIGFSVEFTPDQSSQTVVGGKQGTVFEYARIQEDSGSFIAPSAGTLKVTWDNSFSYLKAKEVWYNVTDFEQQHEQPLAVNQGPVN